MKLLRLPEALSLRPEKRTTFYRAQAEGVLPKPIPVSNKMVAWIEHEINQSIALDVAAARLGHNQFDAWLESYAAEQETANGARPGALFYARAEWLRRSNKSDSEKKRSG